MRDFFRVAGELERCSPFAIDLTNESAKFSVAFLNYQMTSPWHGHLAHACDVEIIIIRGNQILFSFERQPHGQDARATGLIQIFQGAPE